MITAQDVIWAKICGFRKLILKSFVVQNFKTVLIESELFLPLDEKWAALKKVVLIEYFCPDLFIIYDKNVESK